jgi:putative CocE/NonD family hydrolase
MAHAPALQRVHRGENNTALLLAWYDSVRRGEEDQWPKVVYYLMGADAWCASESWPPREARELALYLAADGRLETEPSQAAPDTYIYDPADPTPTTGGSIVSYVFTPGSADIAEVQRRADVLTYTSKTLAADLDIVGPMRMTLFARSSAPDTDFFARISDVFPDGRAIQLQSGLVRARFRALDQAPSLLAPGKVYQFDIDMAATANRFCRGHSIRIDISSADFPKYDRNANLGGGEGDPDTAAQTIFHDLEHPSHVVLMVLGKGPDFACEQTCQERSS